VYVRAEPIEHLGTTGLIDDEMRHRYINKEYHQRRWELYPMSKMPVSVPETYQRLLPGRGTGGGVRPLRRLSFRFLNWVVQKIGAWLKKRDGERS
jgi:hypothetical protein